MCPAQHWTLAQCSLNVLFSWRRCLRTRSLLTMITTRLPPDASIGTADLIMSCLPRGDISVVFGVSQTTCDLFKMYIDISPRTAVATTCHYQFECRESCLVLGVSGSGGWQTGSVAAGHTPTLALSTYLRAFIYLLFTYENTLWHGQSKNRLEMSEKNKVGNVWVSRNYICATVQRRH